MDVAVGAYFFFCPDLSFLSRSGPVRVHTLCRRKAVFFYEETPKIRQKQNRSGFLKKGLEGLIVTLIFILARSFGFLAALYARALVIFLLAQIGQDAGLRAAAFESLQRIVQRLVLLHVNFRH